MSDDQFEYFIYTEKKSQIYLGSRRSTGWAFTFQTSEIETHSVALTKSPPEEDAFRCRYVKDAGFLPLSHPPSEKEIQHLALLKRKVDCLVAIRLTTLLVERNVNLRLSAPAVAHYEKGSRAESVLESFVAEERSALLNICEGFFASFQADITKAQSSAEVRAVMKDIADNVIIGAYAPLKLQNSELQESTADL